MKMNAIFLGYQERDYVSKKTGSQAKARELSVLTEDSDLLVFGYGSLTDKTDLTGIKGLAKGTPVVIDVEITGNRYNRNAPACVVLSVDADQ